MTVNGLRLSVDLAHPDEREVVGHLLQLYLHDWSDLASPADQYGLVDAHGKFSYPDFETYWRGDPERRVYLLRVNDSLAGFAFLNDWSPSGDPADWAMAEFFVMRKYRRAGVGCQTAWTILERHPGDWEFGIAHINAPALSFWRTTLTSGPTRNLREIQSSNDRWNGTIFQATL